MAHLRVCAAPCFDGGGPGACTGRKKGYEHVAHILTALLLHSMLFAHCSHESTLHQTMRTTSRVNLPTISSRITYHASSHHTSHINPPASSSRRQCNTCNKKCQVAGGHTTPSGDKPVRYAKVPMRVLRQWRFVERMRRAMGPSMSCVRCVVCLCRYVCVYVCVGCRVWSATHAVCVTRYVHAISPVAQVHACTHACIKRVRHA